jgi:hypothetical protein
VKSPTVRPKRPISSCPWSAERLEQKLEAHPRALLLLQFRGMRFWVLRPQRDPVGGQIMKHQRISDDRRSVAIAGGSLLSVLLAACLLSIMATAAIVSKQDRVFQYALNADRDEPICIPSSYCLRILSDRFESVANGYRLLVRIEAVASLFELARKLDDGRLKAIVTGPGDSATASIVPRYDVYINADEVQRRADAFLHFSGVSPGRVALAFSDNDVSSPSQTIEISHRDVGKLDRFLAHVGGATSGRGLLALLVLLLAAAAGAMESSVCASWTSRHLVFASLFLIRALAILGTWWAGAPGESFVLILIVLLPWFAILTRIALGAPNACPATVSPSLASLWRFDQTSRRFALLELGVLASALAVFGYMLWLDSSFRWSIFEERDLLEARRLVAGVGFPVYGPELLLGGHTVGSALYLLLAPLVAFWNQPEALHVLNQLLFLGMPLVLWWAIRDWAGLPGALFAVFALVASERVVALSYWPIHPNFSLFFAFLYAGAVLRGAVAGSRGWLIFSGLLLGILVQLHFSYFLLVLGHVLLVLLGHATGDRWTRPLAIVVVFIPLAPFLIIDALQGFPNLAQVVQRPRFHGAYPNSPFANSRLLPMLFDWARQVRGPLSEPLSVLTLVLVGLGIGVGLGSALTNKSERPPMTAPLATTLLLCVPLIELTVLGMGYNSRHTLCLVPALFMLAGFGFAAVLNLGSSAIERTGMIAVLSMIVLLGVRAADAANMTRIIQSEGEWAVDYRSRQKIAADLAGRLGMTPETYSTRTIWWWVGWSVDPAIYADTYRRIAPAQTQAIPWPPDQFALVTAEAELPPLLEATFEDRESRAVGAVYVHVAIPRNKAPLPSSNADTGVKLHPFLQQVDVLRGQWNGFVRLGRRQRDAATRDLFLATVAQGRIKLLMAVERSEIEGRGRLRWCLDSPSLNGHYQEIKTLWRPRVVVTHDASMPMKVLLAGDVLGSLLYKTPICGEVSSKRAGIWAMRLAIDGLFDQSFMGRPELYSRQWELDFDAPIAGTALSQAAIAAWLDARFAH